MIRQFSLLICLFGCYITDAQIKKIPVETIVKNIIVFSSGARVERTASIALSSGRSEINFLGLSNQLDQQSVQLQADANITLLSVQTTKDFLSSRKIDDEEKNFIDRINVLQDKLDVDNKILDVYKNEESILMKNQSIAGQQGIKSVDLKEALDLQQQRLTDIYMKELEIQKKINDEEQKITTIKKEKFEISKKKDSVNYIVVALVESKATRTVNFQLFYNIKDAGWYPAYDVRLNDLAHPFNVTMNANVFQRSGETWKNVSLQLSTGNPDENATPSQLQTWYIGFYDPSANFSNRAMIPGLATGRVTDEKGEPIVGATVMVKGTKYGTSTDANGFFKLQNFNSNSTLSISSVGFQTMDIVARAGYYDIKLKESASALNEVVVIGYAAGVNISQDSEDKVFAKKDLQRAIQVVATNTVYQPTTLVYKIEDAYSLETDGKTTTIPIKQFNIPAFYQYFSAPKIDASSFLTAGILNWKDYGLQSGEANLYFEGTYLGKTYIDLNAADDTLQLSMGKDNGVKVLRKLISQYSSKKFIGSNRTDSRKYEIDVLNTKRDTVSITISDQFPVSTTKDVAIEDQDAPEAQVDKSTGIINWKLILPPGKERKLSVSYSVKYPKDKKIVLD